jgi:hypothetical protein
VGPCVGNDILVAVCGNSVLELSGFCPSHAAWMAGDELIAGKTPLVLLRCYRCGT